MKTIRKTSKATSLLISSDFLKPMLKVLNDQDIQIIKIKRTRELNNDPNIDLYDLAKQLEDQYGFTNQRYIGPIIIITNGNYDDLLSIAKQIAQTINIPSHNAQIPEDIQREIDMILKEKWYV